MCAKTFLEVHSKLSSVCLSNYLCVHAQVHSLEGTLFLLATKPGVSRKIQFQDIEQKPDEMHFVN